MAKAPLIVIVDDDDSVREATKNLIRVLGYHVDAFASAEDFLNSDLVPATSCLITDVQMPGMSGVELQRELSAGGHRTPIIFVTAYPDEAIETRVIRNGAIGYLSKPLQEQSLLACIDEALNAEDDRPT